MPPDDLRTSLLSALGTFQIVSVNDERTAVVRLLKDAMGLSLAEALAAAGRLPVIHEGTRVEVEWLARIAQGRGLEVRLSPASPPR